VLPGRLQLGLKLGRPCLGWGENREEEASCRVLKLGRTNRPIRVTQRRRREDEIGLRV